VSHETLPLVPLSDGAGVVEAVGSGVERLKVGDRVTTLMTRDWISGPLTPERHAAQNGGPLDGVLARHVVLPERALSRFADHLSFAEAACFPVAGLTAWSVLSEAGLRPGQTVLVTGSGNVSLMALQFARIWGAKVIVTTGDVEGRERKLLELGAHAVINYRADDWPEQVLTANSNAGVDVVIENGGMATLGKTLDALRQGAFVGLVGVLAVATEAPDLTFQMLMKNIRLRGILTGSRDSYEELQQALALHRLRPAIDVRFPLPAFTAAFDHAFNGRPFGKVVIEIE
jgi:NADPH:quinone reductase-like Zn-dependent oxidoreductase